MVKIQMDLSEDEDRIVEVYKLTKRLKTPSIKMANILDNLKSKGFIAERTHFDLNAIKTNAPIDDIKNLIYFINRTSTIIKKGKI